MPGRRHNLRYFSRRFSKKNNRWFAAVEQSGLSAANFLVSLLILNYAGVGVLGEYGFWFVLSEFSTMLVAGLAINQMVLHAANSPIAKQREVLFITFTIAVALQVVSGALLWWAVSWRYSGESQVALATPVILYAAMFNLSELTRQFMYMRGRQRLSVFYAAVSTIATILPFVYVVFWTEPESVVVAAFWCLAAAQFGYVAMTAISTRVWRFYTTPKYSQYIDTGSFYWEHGRIAVSGMIVTWAQNKCINPMLQLTMDTVAAGLYQVARMIVMPVNMINAGIARSSMADLRRAWGEGNTTVLKTAVKGQLRTSMRVVVIYLSIVGIVFVLNMIMGWKELPEQMVLVFICAATVLALSAYRSWMACHLVIQLQFAFLLRIGCFAAIFSLLWMFVMGSLFAYAPLVVLGSAVGEIYMLNILIKRFRQVA